MIAKEGKERSSEENKNANSIYIISGRCYKESSERQGMLFTVARGLNQKGCLLFNNFHKPLFAFSLMANSPSPSPSRVSAFSTGSPPPLKRVGTHNGSFHCDEALGCFMIRLTNRFSGAEIVRTRDPTVRALHVCVND